MKLDWRQETNPMARTMRLYCGGISLAALFEGRGMFKALVYLGEQAEMDFDDFDTAKLWCEQQVRARARVLSGSGS